MSSDSQGGNAPRVERSRHGTLVVEPDAAPAVSEPYAEKLTPAPVRSITSQPPPPPHASRYRTHVGIGLPGLPPVSPAGSQPASEPPSPLSPAPILPPRPAAGAPFNATAVLAPPVGVSAPGTRPFSADDEDEATVVMERALHEAGRYSLVPGAGGRLQPSSAPPARRSAPPIPAAGSPAPLQPTPTIPDNPKPERKRSYTPTQVGLPRFEEEEPEPPRKQQPSVADLLEAELAAHGMNASASAEARPGVAPLLAPGVGAPVPGAVVVPQGDRPAEGFGQHKAYDPARAYPELPSAAPYEPGPASAPLARSAVRLNKWLYRAVVFGGALGAVALGVVSALVPSLSLLGALAPVLLLPGYVAQLVLLYKAWSAIQDGSARTSPGKAVGLLFVPLFNLYWVFNVVPGFATDFNRYIQRHRVDTPPISQNLILAAMVVPVFGLVLWWVALGKLCDGVNALSRQR